jgi:ABC-type lipoprotein export system ATPase subunit
MNILGCLDHPTSGEYWLEGREMSRLTANERALVRTERLGFVFQSFNLLSRTSAVQNVLMPLDYSTQRQSTRETRRLAQTLLRRIGLAERAHHVPSQMSGGQQQRVAISRALINHPALVLADEPTGNLDSHTSVEILRMFQQLNAEGITIVLVTHDPKVAAYAHRTICITDGMIEDDTEHTNTCDDAGTPLRSADDAAMLSHGGTSPKNNNTNRGRNGKSTAVSTLPFDTTSAVAVAALKIIPRHRFPQSEPRRRPMPFANPTMSQKQMHNRGLGSNYCRQRGEPR